MKLNNVVLWTRAAAAKHAPKRKINISLNVNYILNIFKALPRNWSRYIVPSKGKNINFTILHLVCLCHCVTLNPLKYAANTNSFIDSSLSIIWFHVKVTHLLPCGCSALLPHHKPERFDSLLSHQLFRTEPTPFDVKAPFMSNLVQSNLIWGYYRWCLILKAAGCHWKDQERGSET